MGPVLGFPNSDRKVGRYQSFGLFDFQPLLPTANWMFKADGGQMVSSIEHFLSGSLGLPQIARLSILRGAGDNR